MKHLGRLLFLATLVAGAAGCPPRGGRAEPAKVEIEWADAAPRPRPAPPRDPPADAGGAQPRPSAP